MNAHEYCQGTNVRFVSWAEAQTMIYLKISLSDFFTVFSARCRSWYVLVLLLLLFLPFLLTGGTLSFLAPLLLLWGCCGTQVL